LEFVSQRSCLIRTLFTQVRIPASRAKTFQPQHRRDTVIKLKSIAVALGLAGIMAGPWERAGAAGFMLFEQSGSGLGNAFAGGAAAAEDASTVFLNPAGLTRLPGQQFAVAVHAIQPVFEFDNQGSTIFNGQPLRGTEGGNAGELAIVPNLYYAMDLTPRLKFGLGVNVPFGLKTEYSDQSIARYHAIKSEVTTANINPSLAFKVNDLVSIGGGVNYQRITAELTNAIDFGSICFVTPGLGAGPCTALGITPQNRDGKVKLEANDGSWGYNVGVLFTLPQETRIGIHYRSSIEHTLEGSAKFASVPAVFAASPVFRNGDVKASIKLPETISLSSFQQLNPTWALMGDITWVRWSRFDELRARFANGAPDNVTPENWDDSYRVSLGINYQASDAWKIRAGVAYDDSPVSTTFRTPRIPDDDRIWVALGASFKASKQSTLDIGYVHIFLNGDADLNLRSPTAGNLRGEYDGYVDILSVQFTHTF
jgi:long-chain fatty acid transport protein